MENYRIAVTALGDAVTMLKSGKGGAEFNRLFRESEDRRITCGKTLQVLEEHRKEHGC
jgi:hypothetical protein